MIPTPITELTEQEIQNLSFDQDYDVLVAELLGTDGTNLTRIAVDSSGYLKVTI